MNFPLFKIFFHTLFSQQGRQRVLVIALASLSISSMALLILHSSMGGLQKAILERARLFFGEYTYSFPYQNIQEIAFGQSGPQNQEDYKIRELQEDVLVEHQGHILPVVLHGMVLEDAHFFLKKNGLFEVPFTVSSNLRGGCLLSYDLALSLGVSPSSRITLRSLTHMLNVFGEVPRFVELPVRFVKNTSVQELDSRDIWCDWKAIRPLVGDSLINTFRSWSSFEKMKLQEKSAQVLTWQQKFSPLVFSLTMEKNMMSFLFICMCALIGVSIFLGSILFYQKIFRDVSFLWPMGVSLVELKSSLWQFSFLLLFLAECAGLFFGYAILLVLKIWGGQLFPDIFSEQFSPVFFSFEGLLVSFILPFFVSLLVSFPLILKFFHQFNPLTTLRSSDL